MGKTSSLIWLIEESKTFHKIYMYTKKLGKPLHRYLIDEWEKLSEKQGETLIEYSEPLDDIPSLKEVDESIQNLFIFDDMIVEKNLKQVEELFVRERKSNASAIFSSAYFKTPQTIRQHSNYFLLTPGLSGKNVANIATDHTESDEFIKEYREYSKRW